MAAAGGGGYPQPVATKEEAVDRETVEKFLRTSIAITQSQGTRTTLKEPGSGRPGLKLVEIQKKAWEDLGISVAAGRQAVGRIKENFPDHAAELLALRDEFGKAIDRAYLQCLEDRRPQVLKKKGKMSKNTVLEFFDACLLKYDSPDVQQRLRSEIQETGNMPDVTVNEVHDQVMELLGFEREYGQACFKGLGENKEFAADRQVATGQARWRGKTSNVCFKLLNEYQKEGGKLNLEEEVHAKLLEVQAKEELDAMTFEERSVLLEKNAKKVNIFRNLPVEARKAYRQRLGEEEKMELAKSEILMITILQNQPQELLQSQE